MDKYIEFYFTVDDRITIAFFFCRQYRLGNKGIDDVINHPFFKNDIWDFRTIRDNVPPVVHELSGDDDTRNFDDVENEAPIESFPTPKAFAGNHLPFVGFTYSKDHQLLTERDDEKPPPIPGRVSSFIFKLSYGINRKILVVEVFHDQAATVEQH